MHGAAKRTHVIANANPAAVISLAPAPHAKRVAIEARNGDALDDGRRQRRNQQQRKRNQEENGQRSRRSHDHRACLQPGSAAEEARGAAGFWGVVPLVRARDAAASRWWISREGGARKRECVVVVVEEMSQCEVSGIEYRIGLRAHDVDVVVVVVVGGNERKDTTAQLSSERIFPGQCGNANGDFSGSACVAVEASGGTWVDAVRSMKILCVYSTATKKVDILFYDGKGDGIIRNQSRLGHEH